MGKRQGKERPKKESFQHNSTTPVALRCPQCPEYPICGGIAITGGAMDCLDLCTCPNPAKCTMVCKKNPLFYAYVREVGGFLLDKILHPYSAPPRPLPVYVPHVYHGSRRERVLISPAVAVCLSDLFSHKTGKLLYGTKEELSERLHIRADAALVILGVDEDTPIESYWSAGRAGDVAHQLKKLAPAVISAPNYSFFNNVPRWNDLANFKRIITCWEELSHAGLPASLHLNARTDRDWERWRHFVTDYPEVRSVTFEFATGAKSRKRAGWHVANLIRLAEDVKRPLHMIARGGTPYLRVLARAFDALTYVDTNAFTKSVKRQKLCWKPGQRSKWVAAPTEHGQPIDDLFQHNVDVSRTMIAAEVPESKGVHKELSAGADAS